MIGPDWTETAGTNASRLSAAAFRWFNDLSPQGILMTDAQLNIRGWNQWLEARTGRTAEEMIGKNLLEAYPDLVGRRLDEYYNDALAGQIRVISQKLHRFLIPMPNTGRASFEHMQQSARIAPLIDRERVIGTITVIEDVTERVDREDELVSLLGREKAARAEAEAANRAKDEFLATVSHELRTPLHSISGWVQILSTGKLDEEASAHAFEAIQRAAKAQTRLIEDILDASRIITGKLHLEIRPVDLATIVQEALDTVRPVAGVKAIEITAEFDPRGGLVSGDSARLQQVVWNLLSNAIKFTPRAGRVSVSLQCEESHVELRVVDTGQGINPAFLPFVYDRFRQANNTSARKHGGLGLGLAIVRHLVEMHGGTVQADSQGEGLGSTFSVRLPLMIAKRADEADRDAQNESQDIPRLNGIRVLIVDDERDAREMLCVMLEQRGVEAQTADSASEAFKILQAWKPDVLLSDVGMPGEDGYALIAKVRALAPELGGRVPAVALTGYAGPEDSQRLTSAGYNICVAKPVEFAELLRTVASLTGRSAAKTANSDP
jgi:PAS domain S-box-containing protein